MIPYAFASSADIYRSRSESRSITSVGCPVCLANNVFSSDRVWRISRAAISMSAAVPCDPLDGWWIMIRAFGRAARFPLAPVASKKAPIEAAIPMQIVLTGARRC